jgi:alpha-L-rhamnosidase
MVNNPSSLVSAANSRGRNMHRRHGKPRHRQESQHLEHGKWIWIREQETSTNSFILARKIFSLPSLPTKAILYAAAETRYKLYINGEYIGRGSVPSGKGHTYFDNFDVTKYLVAGKNVIAFLVHFSGNCRTKRPGLLCCLDVEIDEQRLTITTDETWKVRKADDRTSQGERIAEGLGFQEVYDAGMQIKNWNQVKFREKGWENASVVGLAPNPPWGMLVPREIPQLAEEKINPRSVFGTFNSPPRPADTDLSEIPDIMAATALSPLTSGNIKDVDALLSEDGLTYVRTPRGDAGVVVILDFGKEVFGDVEIGIAGSGKGIIDIGYGELIEEGRVKPNRGGLKYTDRLILRNSKFHWQSFEPRAFRYMQIEFRQCTRQVAVEYVRVNQLSYPVKQTSNFECSDSLLNEIWRAGVYTTKLCMQDTFITSPWSERAQWWGDARIQSRVAYYAFGDTKLLAQGLKQIADSQESNGAIPGMYPPVENDIIADYALLWVFSILDYYAFSNDPKLLKLLYPKVRRLLAWFGKYTGEDRLLSKVPARVFIDHADLQREGDVTILNCLYYQGLRVASIIASLIGKQQDAEQYAELATRLRLAINKHLYSANRGLYAEGRINGKLVEKYTSQTNIVAALFDIPDHYQKSTICRRLLNGTLPQIGTPYFASFLLELLYSVDLHAEALDIIRKKWGPMINVGNSTLWENFTLNGDMCHGWSVCPTRDLLAEYVGIKPALGSHRFSIAPHTGRLKWAKGSIATDVGSLIVEWRVGKNYLLIKIEVPHGLMVDVYPPGPSDSHILVDGKHYPWRFITLSEGSHQIKVTAPKPERSPKYDESLAPTPIEHVEILGEVYSHRAEHRSTAKRRRGKGRVKTSLEIEAYPEPEAVIDETLDVVQERIEDEFEESNIDKLEKMQPEQSVLVAMSQATDALPESGADVKDDVRNQTRSRGTRKKRSVTIENSDCPNSSKA